MAERLSTGMRTDLARAFAKIFENGILDIRSGTQPTTGDLTESGSLLCSCTASSGTLTQEVRATATITVTGGSVAGSFTAIAIGGVTTTGIDILGATVTWASSHTNAAALIAAQINTYNSIGITATSDAAIVTLTAPPGVGAVTWDVTTTVAGDATVTDANFSGGTAPVNGLKFGIAASGAVAITGTWSGVIATSGTAGWARLYDADYITGASTTARRMDFSIATSGADINLSSTTLTAGATLTIGSGTITVPAS